MKPILIIQNEDDSGFIRLTKEALEEIIIDSYEQGKADATRVTAPLYFPPNTRSPFDWLTTSDKVTCGGSYGG